MSGEVAGCEVVVPPLAANTRKSSIQEDPFCPSVVGDHMVVAIKYLISWSLVVRWLRGPMELLLSRWIVCPWVSEGA